MNLFELASALSRFDAALLANGVATPDRDAILEAVVRGTVVAGPIRTPTAERIARSERIASDFMADGDRIANDLALHAHLDG